MKRRGALVALAGLSSGCLRLTSRANGTRTEDASGTESETPGIRDPQLDLESATKAELWSIETREAPCATDGDDFALATGVASREISIHDAETGDAQWSDATDYDISLVTATFTDTELLVFAELSDGRTKLLALNRETGEVRRERDITGRRPDWAQTFGNAVVSGLMVSPDNQDQNVGHIRVRELDTLDERWTSESKTRGSVNRAITIDETLYISFDNFLEARSIADGTRRYRAPLSISVPVGYEGDLIASIDGSLRRMNSSNLEYKWSLGTEVLGNPVIKDDLVAVPTTDGILVATVEGEQLWQQTLDDESTHRPNGAVFHGGLLWVHSPGDIVRGFIPRSGEIAYELSQEVIKSIGSTDSSIIIEGSTVLSGYTVVSESDQ